MQRKRRTWVDFWVGRLLADCSLSLFLVHSLAAAAMSADKVEVTPVRQMIEDRCTGCHDKATRQGGLNLVGLLETFDPWQHRETWV